MNRNLRHFTQMSGLMAGLFLVGCSGTDPLPDAGPTDIDAGNEVDAGVRALCPLAANNPTCQAATDCEEDRTKPMRCEFCFASNDSICQLGQCVTPERLEQVQSIQFSFNAPDLVVDLKTFARMAVTAETSGGNEISCDDVLNGRIDWTEQCYNIIDSRANTSGGTPGGAFSVLFSQIPAGQKTLFIIYGFEQEDAMGDPIGVACAEAMVPARGETSEMMPVAGGDMKSLR